MTVSSDFERRYAEAAMCARTIASKLMQLSLIGSLLASVWLASANVSAFEPSDPAKRVVSFYKLLENRDYRAAWHYLGASMRQDNPSWAEYASNLENSISSSKVLKAPTLIDGIKPAGRKTERLLAEFKTQIEIASKHGDEKSVMRASHITYWTWEPGLKEGEWNWFLVRDRFADITPTAR